MIETFCVWLLGPTLCKAVATFVIVGAVVSAFAAILTCLDRFESGKWWWQ